MPQFVVTFDVDWKAMKAAGYSDSQINNKLYKDEIETALADCGFTAHPEGSVYHTEHQDETDSLRSVVKLKGSLSRLAPTFCKYVRSIHLFRMDGMSNILADVQDPNIAGAMVPANVPAAPVAPSATPASAGAPVAAAAP